MIGGNVALELHQHVYCFVKLFLTDAEAEKFKGQLLLDVKCQLKVELGRLLVRQHVVD